MAWIGGWAARWAVVGVVLGMGAGARGEERVSLDGGWRFIKGDPAGVGDSLSYSKIKDWVESNGDEFVKSDGGERHDRPGGNLGGDVAYVVPGFDDSSWRKLDLPHDWGIEGPFDITYPGDTGKLPWWGVAWYRKSFDVGKEDAGKKVFLDVDGAMSYANVWCNGEYAGGWPYGYQSWRVDLTPYLKAGKNVVAIRLDNPKESSRWYPGGGIYRNVWLEKSNPVHVGHWGVYVTTPGVSKAVATVAIKTDVVNESDEDAEAGVATAIYELGKDGQRGGDAVGVIKSEGETIGKGKTATVGQQIKVANPKLWSIAETNRYVAVTAVSVGGKVVDTHETPFGIRTAKFDAEKGFLLNGEVVKIQGVCDHHDLGALGSALNERALQRQLEILKEMGCNAIRTSHNPPAPELLELADRMGFVVMDEAFDEWVSGKRKNGYHLLFPDWHEKDLRAQVRRDRDHPCVVMWSIGNEIREQGSAKGHKVGEELAAIAHDEDPTRPVTAACNDVRAGYNGFEKIVDVFGYNYKPGEYGKFREANPAEPIFGSETASCVSSRGVYVFPVSDKKDDGKANFQVSSYDLYAPRWAWPPDVEFAGLDKWPFVAGEFVWTGFDYLGEPTPYNADMSNLLNFTDPAERARAEKELAELGKVRSPARSSYFGIVDLAGFKKDRFYIYQARWRPELAMAHILPHWNWPGRVGEVTPVHVYTSGDEAELFLNGKSLGRKKKGEYEYRLRWDEVKYEPGELKVVAYKDGKEWASDVVKTTGAAAKVGMTADRSAIAADGKDLSFVTVTVQDKEGLTVPTAKDRLSFSVEGPGEIVATDNGDATDLEVFSSKERDAFGGMALVIVRATGAGRIVVRGTGEGLDSGEVEIEGK